MMGLLKLACIRCEGGNFEKKPPNPGFVIGKHDHEAEMEGDLEFKVGDRIEVIDTHSSGWWFGKNLRIMLKGGFFQKTS